MVILLVWSFRTVQLLSQYESPVPQFYVSIGVHKHSVNDSSELISIKVDQLLLRQIFIQLNSGMQYILLVAELPCALI